MTAQQIKNYVTSSELTSSGDDIQENAIALLTDWIHLDSFTGVLVQITAIRDRLQMTAQFDRDFGRDLGLTSEDSEDENYCDVRFQMMFKPFSLDESNRKFSLSTWLHEGDSQYDTDHRGYWGHGSVTPDLDDADLSGLAIALMSEAIDHLVEAASSATPEFILSLN